MFKHIVLAFVCGAAVTASQRQNPPAPEERILLSKDVNAAIPSGGVGRTVRVVAATKNTESDSSSAATLEPHLFVIVADTQTGVFWWASSPVPRSADPATFADDIVKRIRVYADGQQLVVFGGFDQGVNVGIAKEFFRPGDDLAGLAQASLRRAMRAGASTGDLSADYVVTVVKALGLDFISAPGSSNTLGPLSIESIQRLTDGWELTVANKRNRATLTLSQNFELVKAVQLK